MANAEQLALLGQGVKGWNEWRRRAEIPEELPDLTGALVSGADLSEADLSTVNFTRADLSYAYLTRADLSYAYLNDANLYEARLDAANLTQADLSCANLSDADLAGANLSGANLREANLSGANLSGASLREANLRETVFADTNLTNVQGLDACRHVGPSIIDHRTLAKSGPLPLRFLRGCGLPDQFIEYVPSLFNQAIQFHSCFISYSTKDETFAERLHADLQNKGVRCWFVPHRIQGGKKVHEQIDEAIRLYDRLLLILSEHSMKSDWVKTEIANARQKENSKQHRVLFPISLVPFAEVRKWTCFDADIGKDSAREIREYFIPDFSEWKNHDHYQKAFERLLKDLKAEEHQT